MVATTWSQTAGMTSDTETDNIADYAEQAEASKDAAAASETAAQTSATSSASSASGSSSSAAEALASKTAAAVSETNAASSATTAATQASNSSTSATASETSRVASVAAQAAAETAETAAETAQTAAEAAEAGVAADAATATAQAAIATTQATNSGTSATASEVSRVAAVAAQAAAETAETNAETAETNAETAQTAAETAETNAASSSSSASTSASTATTQAGIATTKAGEAATSATASASSATASEAAKDAALSALDNFQDQYLGDFATDPTTDNDGDPLQAGMLYFNTTDDVMKVYTGSAWVAAYASLSGALLTTNNLSDLASVPTARTNLGLGTAATTAASAYATSAQGGLADSAVQPNDSPSFGSVTVTGTVDGRDVSSDGTKLDGVEASADVTDTANVTAAGAAMETGAAFTGNVTFGDNDKAIFGAGSDLQIYHDGSHSRIDEQGTGVLFLQTNGTNIQLNKGTSENMLVANVDGSVDLYYDNSKKLATTSTGIDVTGTVTMDGGSSSGDFTFGDNDKAVFGAGSDLQIYHDGSNSNIKDAGTGPLKIFATDLYMNNSAGSKTHLSGIDGGAVTLYHNGSPKLATTATGIDVTGTVTADGLTVDGSSTTKIVVSSDDNTAPRGLSFTTSSNQELGFLTQEYSTGYMTLSSGTGTYSSGLKLKRAGKDAIDIDGPTGDISFYEDTGTTPKFFWDASAESLGIGTSSPVNNANRSTLALQGGWGGQLDIMVGSTVHAQFGTDNFSSGQSARIQSKDGIVFKTNNVSERMRIDSSGNVLVGKTVNDKTTDGIVLREAGEILVARSGDVATFNRKGSDGNIVYYQKDGSTVGSIGTTSGAITLNGTSAVTLNNGTHEVGFGTSAIAGNGSGNDAVIDLGRNNRRFKDLYLSGVGYVGTTQEGYTALSGTTPSIDADTAGGFAISTSGNTTFTFAGVTSGRSVGFVLKLTAGGTHTITWPSSVDWAGGTAPDAPASGETDLLVFYTVNGGTTWYGVLSIDAAA